MKTIKDIQFKNGCFHIAFHGGEWAEVYRFGKSLYSVTSDNLHKSTLDEIKVDFQSFFVQRALTECAGNKKLTEIKGKWIRKY